MSEKSSFVHYLQSKKSVDDRALNQHVWNTIKDQIRHKGKPLKILEIGGGIGTMLIRILDEGFLQDSRYTLVDISQELIEEIPEQLMIWQNLHGHQVDFFDNYSLTVNTTNTTTAVHLVCSDIFEYAENHMEEFDLLIAHAVLDLFDLPAALPKILLTLPPGGLFYTTINYDGITIFEPQINPEFEHKLLELYNQSMDERLTEGKPSGDCRTGRHLFKYFNKLGLEILSAGSSDWVVFPKKNGYPEKEADFLNHLLNTINLQMKGHPEIDPEELKLWKEQRKNQVEQNELVCIVHQMDFLAAIPKD